ncbi:hypothetical protein QJS04_geneDACA009104 [Acorus gramineus]|uniref:NADPH-dependent pterin aldehyde reductase n=1 Tax=Acorus gramineus TaxID=55184 RepID=A0AAV9AS38_ACOGR|nr:hypothetical protein QJS04_geneDACA009104 [Acorus gramineus]
MASVVKAAGASEKVMAGAAKTVMITGVSRGLGRALAMEMARRGHSVVGCARSQETLDCILNELSGGPSHHFVTALDVRSNTNVEEVAKLLMEKKRVPDIIVNNAGAINKNNKIWEVPAEEFDTVMDTNVKGTANVMRHFLPLMIEREEGIIVNLSSGWGRSAAADVAPYCASKWAIEGLSRSVAKEVPPGIAIVALSPGVVNTDMLASCFGCTAAMYQTPEAWAPKAAKMILSLTSADNGASLSVQ